MPGDDDLAARNASSLDIAVLQVLGDALEPVLIESSPDRVDFHGSLLSFLTEILRRARCEGPAWGRERAGHVTRPHLRRGRAWWPGALGRRGLRRLRGLAYRTRRRLRRSRPSALADPGPVSRPARVPGAVRHGPPRAR